MWSVNRSTVKRYWAPFIFSAAIAALPQLAVATYYYGAPWRTGYWGIPMNWAHPKVAMMLVSVERGWWFWHPVAGLGVMGLVVALFNRDRRWFAAAALSSIAVITFVLSCWADPSLALDSATVFT